MGEWQSTSNKAWVEMMTEKKEKKKQDPRLDINPDLPQNFDERIDEKFPKNKKILFIRKILTATDVQPNQNRLSIPCADVEGFEFLNEDEIGRFRRENNLKVTVFFQKRAENTVAELDLNFSQVNMHKNLNRPAAVSSSYVLRTKWKDVVREAELKEHDYIQCWAVRVEDNLVAITVVKVELLVENSEFWKASHHHGFDDPRVLPNQFLKLI